MLNTIIDQVNKKSINILPCFVNSKKEMSNYDFKTYFDKISNEKNSDYKVADDTNFTLYIENTGETQGVVSVQEEVVQECRSVGAGEGISHRDTEVERGNTEKKKEGVEEGVQEFSSLEVYEDKKEVETQGIASIEVQGQHELINIKKLLLKLLKGNKGDKVDADSITFRVGDFPSNLKKSIKKLLISLKNQTIGKEQFNQQLLLLLTGKKGLNLKKMLKDKKIKVVISDKNKTKNNKGKKIALSNNLSYESKEDTQSGKSLTNEKENSSNLFLQKDTKAKGIKKQSQKLAVKNENLDIKESNNINREFKLDLLETKVENSSTGKEKQVDVQKTLLNNKQKMFESIVKNTRIVLANNSTRFSTMIRPESLGRIDLKFNIKDGKLLGKIILQNQEAADFFRANTEELRAVFQKSNVEMEKIDITVAGNQTGNMDGQQKEQENIDDSSVPKNFITYAEDMFEENNANNINQYSLREESLVNVVI